MTSLLLAWLLDATVEIQVLRARRSMFVRVGHVCQCAAGARGLDVNPLSAVAGASASRCKIYGHRRDVDSRAGRGPPAGLSELLLQRPRRQNGRPGTGFKNSRDSPWGKRASARLPVVRLRRAPACAAVLAWVAQTVSDDRLTGRRAGARFDSLVPHGVAALREPVSPGPSTTTRST